MLVKNARFLKSMKKPQDYPDTGLPEIAICGRSNVGKSSLINLLTGKCGLAKVSATPGKTRLVNFFVINEQFVLADLPGYGYAKASKAEQESWPEMIEGYLHSAKNLRALLMLVDIRRNPTDDDLKMFEWASYYGFFVIVAATKADKVPKTQRPARLRDIKASLNGVDYPIVAISSLNRTGQPELLAEIEKALSL